MILEFGYDCYRVGGQWYMWWKGFSSWSEFRAAKSQGPRKKVQESRPRGWLTIEA